ncbi:MAG TPA: hypothetical protein VJ464_14540 [Blastocatellia bacterium]|nr:hypothetical protein [Blastocatellia bacterium]
MKRRAGHANWPARFLLTVGLRNANIKEGRIVKRNAVDAKSLVEVSFA